MCSVAFRRCSSSRYCWWQVHFASINIWSSVLCLCSRGYFHLNMTESFKHYFFDWRSGMPLQNCDFTRTTPLTYLIRLQDYLGINYANFSNSLVLLSRPWSCHWRLQHDGDNRNVTLICQPVLHAVLDQSRSISQPINSMPWAIMFTTSACLEQQTRIQLNW